MAAVARERGHAVTLISGPVSIPPPEGVRLVDVVSAAEMHDAVHAHLPACDVLVMVAAVADWRPARTAAQKLKKREMRQMIELEPTVDILRSVRAEKGSRLLVGFAAETDHVEEEARRKVQDKGLDLIVANDVSAKNAGFSADTNRVTFITNDGAAHAYPVMSKRDVAVEIVCWIESRHRSK